TGFCPDGDASGHRNSHCVPTGYPENSFALRSGNQLPLGKRGPARRQVPSSADRGHRPRRLERERRTLPFEVVRDPLRAFPVPASRCGGGRSLPAVVEPEPVVRPPPHGLLDPRGEGGDIFLRSPRHREKRGEDCLVLPGPLPPVLEKMDRDGGLRRCNCDRRGCQGEAAEEGDGNTPREPLVNDKDDEVPLLEELENAPYRSGLVR